MYSANAQSFLQRFIRGAFLVLLAFFVRDISGLRTRLSPKSTPFVVLDVPDISRLLNTIVFICERFPYKIRANKKGPTSTQKRVYSSGVLLIFEIQIE